MVAACHDAHIIKIFLLLHMNNEPCSVKQSSVSKDAKTKAVSCRHIALWYTKYHATICKSFLTLIRSKFLWQRCQIERAKKKIILSSSRAHIRKNYFYHRIVNSCCKFHLLSSKESQMWPNSADNRRMTGYGWPNVAKFNSLHIYIQRLLVMFNKIFSYSTFYIYIQQCVFSFNFN